MTNTEPLALENHAISVEIVGHSSSLDLLMLQKSLYDHNSSLAAEFIEFSKNKYQQN